MVIYIAKLYKLVIKHTARRKTETGRDRTSRHTDTQTDRQTDKQTERERGKRERERKADREREREREIYTDRDKDKDRDKQGRCITGFGVQSINSYEYTMVSLTTI